MDSTEMPDLRPRFSWSRVALTLLPLLAAVAMIAGYLILSSRWEAQASLEHDGMKRFGLTQPTTNRLADRYTDADGDLVADAPADRAAWVDPELFSFSYVADDDANEQSQLWQAFIQHLAVHLDREFEYLALDDTGAQLQALREGRLHVAGFNSGAVPTAVNSYGFVPVATLGRGDGSFGYKMLLIVPAESPIEQIEDLRGRQITFTNRNSNSGFKAPVVWLMNEYQMLPDRDYSWGFSHSHEDSIARIASGELEAAAVASDMVARAVAAGTIDGGSIRVIHESDRFPPAAVGYAYNLNPELAQRLREAILSFDIVGTPLETEFAGASITRFVSVDYKRDWATIRVVDDAFGAVHAAE